MPFKSKNQWKFMFMAHPEIARRFAHETPTSFAKLPKKVKVKKALERMTNVLTEEIEKSLSMPYIVDPNTRAPLASGPMPSTGEGGIDAVYQNPTETLRKKTRPPMTI